MWEILKKVRYISLSARKGETLEWVMQARPIMTMPPIGVRQRMLLKIEELGGLKIIDYKETNDTYGRDFIYTFELLQPKFDEIYKEYQEKNNPSQRTSDALKEFPTDPEVIEEYLWVVNTIEKERQRTPEGEAIAYPIPPMPFIASGVPMPNQETAILKKLEQQQLIQITSKEVDDQFDPYGITIRAIKIIDLEKFLTLRKRLSEAQRTDLKQEIGQSKKTSPLSTAETKKLCILEKLKEEWDLTPVQAKISSKKHSQWKRECNITDYYEFEAVLNALEKEGLINSFEFVSEYM